MNQNLDEFKCYSLYNCDNSVIDILLILHYACVYFNFEYLNICPWFIKNRDVEFKTFFWIIMKKNWVEAVLKWLNNRYLSYMIFPIVLWTRLKLSVLLNHRIIHTGENESVRVSYSGWIFEDSSTSSVHTSIHFFILPAFHPSIHSFIQPIIHPNTDTLTPTHIPHQCVCIKIHKFIRL